MEDLKNINSLKDIVNNRFEVYKDREAFIQKNHDTQEYEHITYSNVRDEINGLGTYMLKKLKIKGEKVAIIGENSYEWYVTYMAVVCGIGIAVPIDKDLSAEEILLLIKKANIKVIVYSSNMKDIIENIKSEIKGCIFIQINKMQEDKYSLNWRIIVDEGIDMVKSGEKQYIDTPVDSEEFSVLLFTLGEYGESKGVKLNHRNLCSNIYSFSCLLPNSSDFTGFSVLPINYAYEFTLNYLFMTSIGARIGIVDDIKKIREELKIIRPDYMLVVPSIVEKINRMIDKTIEENKKEKGTLINIIKGLRKIGINPKNSIYTKIHEDFGGNLKYICCGTSYLNPEIIKKLEKCGFKFLQCYELTECSPLVASTGLKNNTNGSVGKAVEGVDIRIDLSKNEDENSNIGEIMVSGKNVMIGYYNDEELTKKTIKKDWLYTGDLGYFNLNGELVIIGKKVNLIVDENKKKIYPEELENLINNLPLIKESMVYNKRSSKSSKEVKLVARIELDEEQLNKIYGENIPSYENVYKIIVDEVKKINRMMVSYKSIKEIEIKKVPFIRNAALNVAREEELKNTLSSNIITKDCLKKKDNKKK